MPSAQRETANAFARALAAARIKADEPAIETTANAALPLLGLPDDEPNEGASSA
jgi:hypothetical protein